jgi:hypothetical protein
MKYYFVSCSVDEECQEILKQMKPRNFLLSYAYRHTEKFFGIIWRELIESKIKPNVIIDSGAFTSWSTGKPVKIDDYCKWALRFNERWRSELNSLRYINLDSIPGKKGISASPKEIKVAYEQSMKNADILRKSGLNNLIEVFHQDEPLSLLDILVKRAKGGCIAVSPRNDVSVKERERWLKCVLSCLVTKFGKENIPPCHGLGVSAPRLLEAFPFYSVDSSSWKHPMLYNQVKKFNLPRIPRVTESANMSKTCSIHVMRVGIKKFLLLEEDITKLWAKRGVIWNEQKIR